jgi:hypothetical protein
VAPPEDEVLTGDAGGVDRTAYNYCLATGRKVTSFNVDRVGLPEYGTEESRREFGKRAYERNGRLVAASDRVAAFAVDCHKKACTEERGRHITHGTDNALQWARIHGKPWSVKHG